MPKQFNGAYVSCFVYSIDYVDAVEKALKKLADDGLHPEEILQPINEMKLSDWEEYLRNTWLENVNDLPRQKDFEKAMKSGLVIYSPFSSY